jgi:hypothetical protein
MVHERILPDKPIPKKRISTRRILLSLDAEIAPDFKLFPLRRALQIEIVRVSR